MQLEQRQRYRLHLQFVALCQSISLGIPITRKSNSKVTPIKDTEPCPDSTRKCYTDPRNRTVTPGFRHAAQPWVIRIQYLWWRCGESNPGLSAFIVDCHQLIILYITVLN